jgi:hypothetical protein
VNHPTPPTGPGWAPPPPGRGPATPPGPGAAVPPVQRGPAGYSAPPAQGAPPPAGYYPQSTYQPPPAYRPQPIQPPGRRAASLRIFAGTLQIVEAICIGLFGLLAATVGPLLDMAFDGVESGGGIHSFGRFIRWTGVGSLLSAAALLALGAFVLQGRRWAMAASIGLQAPLALIALWLALVFASAEDGGLLSVPLQLCAAVTVVVIGCLLAGWAGSAGDRRR